MSGKVVIVTGAASGIGLATAQTLFAEGYTVVLVDLSAEKVKAEADKLKPTNGNGNEAWGRATDISNSAAVKELFDEVKAKFGDLYAMTHCAGILGPVKPLHEQTDEEITAVCNVNFLGTVKLVREAVNTFRAQGNPPPSGYPITCIGSFMIVKPVLGAAVYAATKGAVKTFVQTIARENADAGIRINTVNPGGIATGMTGFLVAQSQELPPEVCPLRRWGKPTELANMMSFLISDKASFCTGGTYDVDGGKNA